MLPMGNSEQFHYKLLELEESSEEYINIKSRVEESKGRRLLVTKIERIVNENIEKRYEAKKKEKIEEYPNLREEMLFHGTGWNNIQNICENNFQPSLCIDAEYGKGVYFSQSSSFACIYPGHEYNPVLMVDRPMFLCKVMIGKEFEITDRFGQRFIYPSHPEGYDTTIRRLNYFPLGLVCKCGEDEFLPEFLITYKVLEIIGFVM